MKKKFSENKKVIVVLGILVLVAAVIASANLYITNLQNREIKPHQIQVLKDGKDAARIDMSAVEERDRVEFSAQIKRKVGEPVPHTFSGAALYTLLKNYGIGIEDAAEIVLTSEDNFSVKLTPQEVADPDNVYIVSKMDGQEIKGIDDKGFSYMVVIRKDDVSTRWAKYLRKVEIK